MEAQHSNPASGGKSSWECDCDDRPPPHWPLAVDKSLYIGGAGHAGPGFVVAQPDPGSTVTISAYGSATAEARASGGPGGPGLRPRLGHSGCNLQAFKPEFGVSASGPAPHEFLLVLPYDNWPTRSRVQNNLHCHELQAPSLRLWPKTRSLHCSYELGGGPPPPHLLPCLAYAS